MKLLKSFHYDTWLDLVQSLFPSTRYNLTIASASFSTALAFGDGIIQKFFGLDSYAFIALVLILVVELASGITASMHRKEALESSKLRRFLFRLFYYMVLIAVPYLLAPSFLANKKATGAWALDLLHSAIVLQIVFENTISILENMSVIDGKDKTQLITKLKEKFTNLLS